MKTANQLSEEQSEHERGQKKIINKTFSLLWWTFSPDYFLLSFAIFSMELSRGKRMCWFSIDILPTE